MERKKLDPQTKITGLGGLTISDMFAEFIVAEALGVTDSPRVEWNAFDLFYRGKKIEVKCAGYLQTWTQASPSKIRFDIAKKRGWYAETNTYGSKPVRVTDCYIFCLFEERDSTHPDVLNLPGCGKTLFVLVFGRLNCQLTIFILTLRYRQTNYSCTQPSFSASC